MSEQFEVVLRERRLETVFQPILESVTGVRVGYEALVRGPAGSPLESASALLNEAYRSGRVVEFDWAARASACRAALKAGLDRTCALFLNIEPIALNSTCPADLHTDIETAFARYPVVLEVTERSLERDPAALLQGIDRQRGEVTGVAIDDLGPHAAALAMLPVLAPDVIKLDRSVTRAGPSPATMRILDVAHEEAERTGATILAEGIESSADADFARAVGARLLQGEFIGLPGQLPERGTRPAPAWRPGLRSSPAVATPFDTVIGRDLHHASADVLAPMSRQVAFRGVRLREPAVLLMLLPGPAWLHPIDRRRLADLARRGVLAVVLGPDLPTPPAPGVRGGSVDDTSLDGQWAVIALGPAVASAMLARRVADGAFEFALTHDRGRVVAAAASLLHRLGTN